MRYSAKRHYKFCALLDSLNLTVQVINSYVQNNRIRSVLIVCIPFQGNPVRKSTVL